VTRREAGIVGPNQLWSIILADRPSLIDLSRVVPLAAAWSLVNEQ